LFCNFPQPNVEFSTCLPPENIVQQLAAQLPIQSYRSTPETPSLAAASADCSRVPALGPESHDAQPISNHELPTKLQLTNHERKKEQQL